MQLHCTTVCYHGHGGLLALMCLGHWMPLMIMQIMCHGHHQHLPRLAAMPHSLVPQPQPQYDALLAAGRLPCRVDMSLRGRTEAGLMPASGAALSILIHQNCPQRCHVASRGMLLLLPLLRLVLPPACVDYFRLSNTGEAAGAFVCMVP